MSLRRRILGSRLRCAAGLISEIANPSHRNQRSAGALSPNADHWSVQSIGRSIRRLTPKPRGSRPSIAEGGAKENERDGAADPTPISLSAARKIRLRVAAVADGCDHASSRSPPSRINCCRSGSPNAASGMKRIVDPPLNRVFMGSMSPFRAGPGSRGCQRSVPAGEWRSYAARCAARLAWRCPPPAPRRERRARAGGPTSG